MTSVQNEITQLEERMRLAELAPDPNFFEEVLDDEFVVIAEDGQPFRAKSKVVEAHQPQNAPKFTAVEMSDMQIVDHGMAAVVTCKGTYESQHSKFALRFMRVWVKKNNRWRIVAGSVSQSSVSSVSAVEKS